MNTSTLGERYRAFRAWQHQPHQVAPLSQEEHDCPTCKTHYVGNYCPRCGQSARIGRYSFKTALLNFFDVWGLGNRSMFRTLRDLLLRPGYMIRDYLRGMQMAYFPPFKLFFLLTALSLLVNTGMNIRGEDQFERAKRQIVEVTYAEPEAAQTNEAQLSDQEKKEQEAQKRLNHRMRGATNAFVDLQVRYPNVVGLAWLVLLSAPLFLFFRKAPNGPFRYSEFLVALVYTNNMYSLYVITLDFLCVSSEVQTLLMLLNVIPLKQLSGYGWWSSVFRTLGAVLLVFVPVFVFAILATMFLLFMVEGGAGL